MIGLDTNVLVRYLLKDDPEQVIRVRSLMHSLSVTNPGFISLITLAETAWVLSRTYSFDRDRIAEAISALLHTQELMLEQREAVRTALHAFEESRADFSDCLIAQLGHHAGCEYTVTFDRHAAKLPGMKLLA
ncbi:PIN domain-containing protein [Silvibacterium sp.]|uniref:PIN domain-containing protein n=1 Tax=Silvibacterium sp. TaxID=1964179 RepID=UPI0039E2BAD4